MIENRKNEGRKKGKKATRQPTISEFNRKRESKKIFPSLVTYRGLSNGEPAAAPSLFQGNLKLFSTRKTHHITHICAPPPFSFSSALFHRPFLAVSHFPFFAFSLADLLLVMMMMKRRDFVTAEHAKICKTRRTLSPFFHLTTNTKAESLEKKEPGKKRGAYVEKKNSSRERMDRADPVH